MEKAQFQLEYLKEQYTQARQHETLRTNTTAFLTAAAGVILGLTFRDSHPVHEFWWAGLVVAAVGAANFWINHAHFLGNRLHTTIAGKTRRAIEKEIVGWSNNRPTDLRREALKEYGLSGSDVSLGSKIQYAIQIIPAGIVIAGCTIALWLRFLV